MCWGLIPAWVKDESVGNALINAWLETIESRTAFREAFKHRQCRLIQLPIADFRLPIKKFVGRTADILQAMLFQRDLLTGLIQGQEKLLAMGLPARIEQVPVPRQA